jgi:hypothetical protein
MGYEKNLDFIVMRLDGVKRSLGLWKRLVQKVNVKGGVIIYFGATKKCNPVLIEGPQRSIQRALRGVGQQKHLKRERKAQD